MQASGSGRYRRGSDAVLRSEPRINGADLLSDIPRKQRLDLIDRMIRDRLVRLVPFVNTIRRHHTAHHNQRMMMHKKLNLKFPVADWIMGTSDLNRGLFGTLFNGYDERHVKPELGAIAARFRAVETQEQRFTLDGRLLTQDEQQALA